MLETNGYPPRLKQETRIEKKGYHKKDKICTKAKAKADSGTDVKMIGTGVGFMLPKIYKNI